MPFRGAGAGAGPARRRRPLLARRPVHRHPPAEQGRVAALPHDAVSTSDGKVYQGIIVYEAVDSVILQTGPAATLRLVNKQIASRRLHRQTR